MSYVKVESGVRLHPKFLKAGPAASWLWLCGLTYCQENLTDGFIAKEALPFLGVPNALRLTATLVDVRLWHETDGGWLVHDYLKHNNSATYVKRVQEERRAAGKRGGRPSRNQVEKQFANSFALQDGLQFAKQGENPETETEVQKEQERPAAGCSLDDVETRMLVVNHRRQRSRETTDGKPSIRVIAALARHLLQEHPELTDDEGELMDRIKSACARANLDYNGAVGPALDRARAQLAKRGARVS